MQDVQGAYGLNTRVYAGPPKGLLGLKPQASRFRGPRALWYFQEREELMKNGKERKEKRLKKDR